MERVQKEQGSRDSANATRVSQGRFAQIPAQTDIASRIDNSPQMIAQRKLLQGVFGGTAQLQEVEEKPLQGKFTTVQRVEEEELLQGKFETAQRVEEEELLQGKFSTVQRVEEEEPLQGKFAAVSTAQLEQQSAAKPNNTGLPDNLKTGIESLSGITMDNVKVHYNSPQPAQLNALAYAQGSDIHVAPGQEQHLPHETWHVVQQSQGRVQPTMQMKDCVPVNDDAGLEHEADVMGERAVQERSCDATKRLQVHSYSSPLQLIRSGVIPTSPDGFRTITNTVNNPSYAAIDGHKSFNDTQKRAIREDNESGSDNPSISKESHPLQDDIDNSGLLTQERASNIAPEIDHVVPIDDNGSNDVRNARVVSKSNNMNTGHRPGEGGRSVAVYEDVKIDGTNYKEGDILSSVSLNKLKKVYKGKSCLETVFNIDTLSAEKIREDTSEIEID